MLLIALQKKSQSDYERPNDKWVSELSVDGPSRHRARFAEVATNFVKSRPMRCDRVCSLNIAACALDLHMVPRCSYAIKYASSIYK